MIDDVLDRNREIDCNYRWPSILLSCIAAAIVIFGHIAIADILNIPLHIFQISIGVVALIALVTGLIVSGFFPAGDVKRELAAGWRCFISLWRSDEISLVRKLLSCVLVVLIPPWMILVVGVMISGSFLATLLLISILIEMGVGCLIERHVIKKPIDDWVGEIFSRVIKQIIRVFRARKTQKLEEK